MNEPRWSYGLTTVPQRMNDLLPRTLASLAAGGFNNPRLLVDGSEDVRLWREKFPQITDLTFRQPTIRTYGNWILGLAELFIREPACHFYAIFQDDLKCVRNLRPYLNRTLTGEKRFWNLMTQPIYQKAAPAKVGWFESPPVPNHPEKIQWGKGAVALVFTRPAVVALLTHQHTVIRPMDSHRGWRAIDGAIITAMNAAGYREYVHNPSLVQHTGAKSSMGNGPQQNAPSFPGEEWDAMAFLNQDGAPLPMLASEEWQMFDARGSRATTFTLMPDGSARKSHAPNVSGTWEKAPEGIRVKWEDGWKDLLRDGKKLAFAPGSEFNGHPANVQKAVRQ